MTDQTTGLSCGSCGASLEVPGAVPARFCPQCGTPRKTANAEPGRIRILTLLFVDLVSSTDYARTHGLEAHNTRLQEFQRNASQVFRRYRGQVVQHYGDGQLVAFGMDQDSENAALSAIVAALDLVGQEIGKDIRIGIHSGEVFCNPEGGSGLTPQISGFDLNLTARIEAMAAPGQCVISDAARRFIDRVASLDADDMGPVPLRGVPEPLRLFTVRDVTARPLPADPGALLERDALLERIAGDSGHVCLTGAPGIGKSALLHRVTETIRPDRQVIRLTTRENLQNTLLFPLAYWLCHYLDFEGFPLRTDAAGISAALEEKSGITPEDPIALAATLGVDPGAEAGQIAPAQWQARRIAAMRDVLTGLAARQPLAICLDDLQWCDADTCDVLAALCEECPPDRARLILVARQENALDHLGEAGASITRIAIPPLSAEAALALAQTRSPTRQARSDLKQLIARAEGNPLFIDALVTATDSLSPSGQSERPLQTIEATFQSIIDQQGPTLQPLILRAAILGRSFARGHLRYIAPTPDRLDHDLKALDAANIVQKGAADMFSFRHILIRDAAYAMIPSSDKQRLHKTLLQEIQTQEPLTAAQFPNLIADHAIASADPALIGPAAQAAGLHYLRLGRFELAVRYLHKSLDAQSPGDPGYLDTLTLLGTAQVQQAGFAHPDVEKTYRRLDAAVHHDGGSDGRAAMRAAYGLFAHRMIGGDVRGCATLAAEGTARAAGGDSYQKVLAAVNESASALYSGRFDAVLHHNQQLRMLYDTAKHGTLFLEVGADPLVSILSAEAHVFAAKGQLDRANGAIDAGLAQIDSLGAALQKPWLQIFGASALWFGGDKVRARQLLADGLALADMQGAGFWSLVGRIWQAVFAVEDDPESEALAQLQALVPQLNNIGARLNSPIYTAVIGTALVRRGVQQDGRAHLRDAARRVALSGEGMWAAEVWDRIARTAGDSGEDRHAERAAAIALAYAKRAGATAWEVRAAERFRGAIRRREVA